MTNLDIAKTIQQQVFALGVPVVWSWGARKWAALPIDEKYNGGLEFLVSGAKYKGKVTVRLCYSDTYEVTIGKNIFKDIYCYELARLIDETVET